MVDDRDSENSEMTPLVSSGDGKAYSDSRMDPVSGRPYSSERSYQQQGDERMPLLHEEE